MNIQQGWRELKTIAVVSPAAFWCLWTGIHILLCVLGLVGPGGGFNDVTMPYKVWSAQVFHGVIPGVSQPFVYPFAALAAMLPPWLFGETGYGVGWCVMVFLLNTVTVGLLTRWGTKPGRMKFAWWWLVFIACLGPVALGRIDAVAAAIALIAIGLVIPRPRLAGALLAIGTWIKIWPVAIGIAFVVALKSRIRIIASAAVTAVLVLLLGVSLGGAENVLSFVTQQGSRGLQIEAVVATPLMWLRLFGVSGINVIYDDALMTNQFDAPGSVLTAELVGVLMPIIVVAIVCMALWALRRGVVGRALVGPLSLALVLALIIFNKVGSPQFAAWLAAPALVMFLFSGRWGRVPAVFILVIAALTQLYYPYLYVPFISNDALLIGAFTVRNLLLVALFVWSIARLVSLGRMQVTAAPRYSKARVQSGRHRARRGTR